MKIINIKFLLLAFLLAIWNVDVNAQSDSSSLEEMGWFYILPMEIPVIDKQALDMQLKSAGLPACDFSPVNFGVGLQFQVNRTVGTFSYVWTTKKKDEDNYINNVKYSALNMNVGYDLLKNTYFSLYPYAGFKGFGLNYLYREQTKQELTFGQFLDTSLMYKEMHHSRAFLDLGAGFSYQSYMLINIRAGYLHPLEKSRWKMDNSETDLANAPAITYKYYFSVILGLGSIFRDEGMNNRNQRGAEL